MLLLLGQWVELAGWCLVAERGGPWGRVAAALAGAVVFRRLQEISHFAVHGVLARGRRPNTLLAEFAVHVPLGFVPVPVRRRRHVCEHHPNATVAGVDPNLAELHRAGLRAGATTTRCVWAMVRPLTPAGLSDTARSLVTLDLEPVTGPPVAVEAGRCLRLYPRNLPLALPARATWLPYGDLYHFAHSAHPAVRWNYLPALERSLGGPSYRPHALVLGEPSVLRRHRRALTSTGVTREQSVTPQP